MDVDSLARTTARRRRSSAHDSANGLHYSGSHRIPTAPEAPNATSIYYPPELDDTTSNSFNTFSGSFAQRAALLTGNELPPDPSSSQRVDLNSRSTHKGRRTSLNRPIGGVYSEIQQQRRDSWSAGNSPTYPKRMSIPMSTQNHLNDDIGSSKDQVSVASVQAPAVVQQDQFQPRRASTMSSRDRKEKWAPDRSPLQNLEAKLSDISKEEKRARVEQAEQRLRASKLGIQEQAPSSQEGKQANIARRVSTGDSLPRPSGPRAFNTNGKGKADDSQKQNIKASRLPKPIPVGEANLERGTAPTGKDDRQQISLKKNIITHDNDFFADRDPRDSVHDIEALENAPSKRLLPEQKNLFGSRADPSRTNNTAKLSGGHPDILPGRNAISPKQGFKYEIPSQPAARLQTRRQVGFDREVSDGARNDSNTDHRHHATQPLNQQASSHTVPSDNSQIQSRYLDEWRQASVARLTDQDFLDEPVNEFPWWEKQSSRSRRRSRKESVDTRDSYADGNALYAQKESLGADLEYPYPYPSLAYHGLAHSNRPCEPYLSKELIRSMRSIRIRLVPVSNTFDPPLYLKCGPLLRYTGMKRQSEGSRTSSGINISNRETWRGSVMIVTDDVDSKYEPTPILRLFPEPMEKLPPAQQQEMASQNHEDLPHHYLDPIAGMPKVSRTGKVIYVKPVDDLERGKDLSSFESNDDGLYEDFRSAAVPTAYGTPEYRPGQAGPSPRSSRQKPKPKKGHRVQGVRLHAERGITFWRFNLEVELQDGETRIAYSINNGPAIGFWVPARGQTMNIMFHSCNGFSLTVNPDDFSGPDPLWRDVLNSHQTRPFHVMIGGGDQIYNDAVMRQSPLFGEWLDIKNPHHKHEAELTSELLEELETFYLERYSMWFSQGLFGMANAQIPMINIWDDHDIIDGFGSYPHHFMSTPVFSGLGAVAFKYYMLFQHHSVPAETAADEPSWLLGAAPGPYINELSRSVFMSLGKHVAFLGLDCRTERMREEVLSQETYDIIFDRCKREIIKGETKHLIVLSGVPIAYPRLVWLENVLTSRALDPIKAMNRMGMLGNLLNKFDGGVEILDDLDDHWTAKNHKQERNWFIQELQELAADLSIRVTILGGDVHLAAVGQFYSHPKLNIRKDQDHRYMPNIISSAIVNTPPPEMMSDILNKRNKTHHLDPETEENMIPMFSHDVDGKSRNNKRLLPRRNWCSIRQYEPGSTPPASPELSESEESEGETTPKQNALQRNLSLSRGEIKPRQLIRRLSGKATESYVSSTGDASASPSEISKWTLPFRRQQAITRSYTTPQRTSTIDSLEQGKPARPSFLRRPSNMEQKNAGSDDTADTHRHVNIEYGLDIAINCEIDQQDPAGATIPYRLLIPALFYDGEADENTTVVRRPNLLQRINSLRGTRGTKVAQSQGQGYWGRESREDSDVSDVSDGLSDGEANVKPRRWSFGMEKRRRYRDQSPSQQRNPQLEAQELGQLAERPKTQHPPQPQSVQHRPQTDLPSIEPDPAYNVPPSRHANRFQRLDDSDDSDGDGSREELDSIDYHANIDSSMSRHYDDASERRLSKAEKMLGVSDGEDHIQSQRRTTMPLQGREEFQDYRLSSGYDGIDAYPGNEKGWRRSLRLFT